MDIQGICSLGVNLLYSGNCIKCGNEFDTIMQQISEDKDVEEMKEYLDEKFNITTIVTEYSCESTDSKAENYDLAMLEKYDMTGARNVVISKKSLLRMKNDIRFRQKVFESIEGLSCTSKLTGGMIKSTGVFIHEDGTGGYWTEFDWGDDEDEAKSPKNNVSIFGIKSAQITNNYISVNRNISEQFLNSIMVINSCYIEEDRKKRK